MLWANSAMGVNWGLETSSEHFVYHREAGFILGKYLALLCSATVVIATHWLVISPRRLCSKRSVGVATARYCYLCNAVLMEDELFRLSLCISHKFIGPKWRTVASRRYLSAYWSEVVLQTNSAHCPQTNTSVAYVCSADMFGGYVRRI